jgi:hypothetical protein
METNNLQKYLDELAAHREIPGEIDGAATDPALQELAAAITTLEHPTFPATADSRYRAYLLLSTSLTDPAVEPAPAGLNDFQTTISRLITELRSRFTSLQLVAGSAVMLGVIFLCTSLLLATFLLNNNRMKMARVTAVDGRVEELTDEGWTPLQTGDSVKSGQRIRTNNDSSATVRFFEGTETTLTADTDVTLTTVSGRLGSVLQVTWTQLAGATKHEVVPLRGRTAFYQLETPGGMVQVHGTSFTVAVQPQGRTHVSVTEGQVAMTGAGETVAIQAGQATVGGPGVAPEAPTYQFAGQGELTNIAGTLWTIGNLPVTVISQTVIVGSPTLGDFVSVSGRVLDGNVWLADLIQITSPGASSFSFTAPIESIGPNFWQIGGVTVAVTGQTQQIGNLELGTLAQVTFTVLSDGTLVALVIEEIGGPPPTPTPTATFTTTVTVTPTATTTPTVTPTMTPVPPIIINCYQVTFLGVDYNPNNTSTWSYHVAELPCAQDLSNWMVALPDCALPPLSAAPEPWEFVNPDPNFQLTGVKWEVGDVFEQGVFTVTVSGHWDIGLTQFGVKGPDVGIGVTAGPICEPPSPTLTPTGSATPTATPTMTMTPTATISATPTISVTATPTLVPPTPTPVPPTDVPSNLVTICHKPGTPAEKTMTLPAPALSGHLGHGDTLGPCP